MDELEIAGQRYLSTRRAGKEHKYHSDYIGQLIRSGKVIGKKVGRSWYVQEQSLNAYLSGEQDIKQHSVINSPEEVPAVKIKTQVVREVEQTLVAPQNITEKINQPAPPVVEEKMAEVVETPEDAVASIKTLNQAHFNSTPVRRVPIDDKEQLVTLNTSAHSNKISITKTQSLRYIADDSPALPGVQIKKIATTVSEEVPTYESEYLPSVEEVREGRSGGILSLATLVVIGVIAFSVSVGASIAISSQTIIEEGQVAGAGFTLK